MTPRVQVTALEVQATAEDVANATRATGLSRFPVYRGSLDTVVGVAHIKDVLAVPAEERPPHARVGAAARAAARTGDPDRGPAARPAVRQARRWPSSSTSTAARPESSRWRTSSRRSSARYATSTTRTRRRTWHRPVRTPTGAPSGRPTAPPAPTSCGRDRTAGAGRPYETLAGLIATELGRIPAVGDRIELAGWRLDVVDASGRRAARVLLHAPLPGADDGDGGRTMTAVQLLIGLLTLVVNAFFVGAEFALISVRRSQIEPQAEAGRPAGAQRHLGSGACVGAAGGGAAGHHAVHAGARYRRRTGHRASAGAASSTRWACRTDWSTRSRS